MSKNEPWLLALGENLKISIFDPPSVGGTCYIMIIIIIIIIKIIIHNTISITNNMCLASTYLIFEIKHPYA